MIISFFCLLIYFYSNVPPYNTTFDKTFQLSTPWQPSLFWCVESSPANIQLSPSLVSAVIPTHTLPPLSSCTAPPLRCPALQIPAPSVFWNFFVYLLSFGRHRLCLDWWQQNALRQTDEAILGFTTCVSFSPGSLSCSACCPVPFKDITISGTGCKRERVEKSKRDTTLKKKM